MRDATSGGRLDASDPGAGGAHAGDTRAERLADALNDFLAASPDVEAAAVVSFDGLAMASALPADMDEDRLGAMSAALLSLGEQAASGLGRGDLKQVFVEGERGYVFLMSALDQAVLAAVTGRSAKIGLMLFEMRRAATAVGGVLAPVEDVAAASPDADETPEAGPAAGGDTTPAGGVLPATDEAQQPHNGSAPAAAVPPPWN